MWELYAWLFMRLSGAALLILALVHLAVMHIFNDSATINYAFVMQRWANPWWRVYDGLLLALGTVHGVNGLRVVVEDHMPPTGLRRVLLTLLFAGGVLLVVLGAVALITAA